MLGNLAVGGILLVVEGILLVVAGMVAVEDSLVVGDMAEEHTAVADLRGMVAEEASVEGAVSQSRQLC